jgi:anthranilate synthase component I
VGGEAGRVLVDAAELAAAGRLEVHCVALDAGTGEEVETSDAACRQQRHRGRRRGARFDSVRGGLDILAAMLTPDYPTFARLATHGTLIPVAREFLFDTDTAVSAYHKLRRPPFGFLLESLVGGEKWARYTFLGTAPRSAWRLEPGGRVSIWQPESGWSEPHAVDDPLAELDAVLRAAHPVPVPGLPRFFGGAVGYLGYDVIRYIERLPSPPPDPLGLPEALLVFTDTVLAIDNIFGRAHAVTTADLAGAEDPNEV